MEVNNIIIIIKKYIIILINFNLLNLNKLLLAQWSKLDIVFSIFMDNSPKLWLVYIFTVFGIMD